MKNYKDNNNKSIVFLTKCIVYTAVTYNCHDLINISNKRYFFIRFYRFLMRASNKIKLHNNLVKYYTLLYCKFTNFYIENNTLRKLFKRTFCNALKCSVFDSNAVNNSGINNNNNNYDSNLKFPFCCICERYFVKNFHFLQHLRVHYNLRMYRCFKCHGTFAQQNGLNYHVKHCENNSIMSRDGKSIIRYNNKKGRLVRKEIYEYCQSCGIFVTSGDDLRDHYLKIHARNDLALAINKDQRANLLNLLKRQNIK